MEIIDQTAKVVMLKGEGGDTIKSIDKTTTQGLVDIYTITLESGNKKTFNVTNGNGIKTIEKTSTSGLIDTYTVTFDDGETTTFTVTNGEKGEKGDKGDTGPQGPQGPKGEKGDPGDGGGIANVDTELSATSTNPVQNKAIAEGINSIQNQIVPTASIESGAFASKAYNAGDFLVKDGILYKVTNAIAEGDALTVGTNIALDTVASELSEIKSNLPNGLTVDILADANSFNLTDLDLTQYKLLVATHYETGGGSTGTTTVPMSLAIARKTVSFEWNGGGRAVIKIPSSTSMSMASIHQNKANRVVVMGIK